MISTSDLRVIPQFSDLPDDTASWLASRFTESVFEDGEEPFEPGAPADVMMIVIEGEMQILVKSGPAWRHLDTLGPGRISGVLPYSRMKEFGGMGKAVGRLRIGTLPKSDFPEVLYRIPVLGERLIGLMSDRVRSTARADQEREKMLALGKLSAGLAHELNNPAAAVHRAADDLRERLNALPAIVARLSRHGLSPDAIAPGSGYCSLGGGASRLSALDLGDREDAILDWLEDRDIEDAWKIAPTLAEEGLTVDDLERAAARTVPEAVGDVVAWMENTLGANRLIAEIHASAGRISELVGSVKSYSHMDRSTEKQVTDLAAGLESTLTMLGHKLRGKSISVEKDIANQTEVPAYPGELNQVWTNLIDNAIDAMDEEGTLKVSVRVEGAQACVSIADNGSGIPEEVLPRIFEPFFSTKDVGQGTGLGLEIAHRIVTQTHQGTIAVSSQPGKTEFVIRLPLG